LATTSAVGGSRPVCGVLFAGLVAGVLALATPSGAVVYCTPTAGEIPILKVSPAAVPPPADGNYGFKLKTTLDGCIADAAKLNVWIPSKKGTADGALIAQAEMQLSVAGYGNCGFGILTSDPAAYVPTGTLKLKWLDAAGDTIKSAKPTSASVRVSGMSFSQAGLTAIVEGFVTKGLGIGASVQMSIPIQINLADPFSDPWALCIVGNGPIPPIPGLPAAVPLKEFKLRAQPSVAVGFPSLP
jgi:hypothetical protein